MRPPGRGERADDAAQRGQRLVDALRLLQQLVGAAGSCGGDAALCDPLAAGEVDVRLDIQNNHIAAAAIYGDFMGQRDVAELAQLLVGVEYSGPAIALALQGIDVGVYVANLTTAEVLALLAP